MSWTVWWNLWLSDQPHPFPSSLETFLQSCQNTLTEFRAGEFLAQYWAKEENKKQLRISDPEDGWDTNPCWVGVGRCWRFGLDSEQGHSSENKADWGAHKASWGCCLENQVPASSFRMSLVSGRMLAFFQSRTVSSEEWVENRRSLWWLVPLKTINSFWREGQASGCWLGPSQQRFIHPQTTQREGGPRKRTVGSRPV